MIWLELYPPLQMLVSPTSLMIKWNDINFLGLPYCWILHLRKICFTTVFNITYFCKIIFWSFRHRKWHVVLKLQDLAEICIFRLSLSLSLSLSLFLSLSSSNIDCPQNLRLNGIYHDLFWQNSYFSPWYRKSQVALKTLKSA